MPGTNTGVSHPLSLVPKLLQTLGRNYAVYLIQHYKAALKRWRCCLLRPTTCISIPFTWSQQIVALRASGGGQPLVIFSPFRCQRTSWWVCPIAHETTECLYNYLPLVFVNCYGNWTPVKGTIVDVRDIVTPSVWCLKHCNLLESFHGAAEELCILKVSTYWGTGHLQGHEGRSRLPTLCAYFLLSQ